VVRLEVMSNKERTVIVCSVPCAVFKTPVISRLFIPFIEVKLSIDTPHCTFFLYHSFWPESSSYLKYEYNEG
jgi:hypothetical protein